MRLDAGWRAACRSGRFLGPLFEGSQLHKRPGRRQGKIASGQSQRLINTRAGIPERRQQHLTVQIRDIMEQGADLRCQQVFRELILDNRHLAQGQRRRVIDGHR
ncbi:Uncharacterised protein [Enterobacter cloacae]|nr:Uncharacterised protein [Enterobacter cloacae]